MNVRTVKNILLFSTLYIWQTSHADIGEIAINGKSIDPDLFDDEPHAWINCDAYSEIDLKAGIIDKVLITQEGEANNIQLSSKRIAEYEEMIKMGIENQDPYRAMWGKNFLLSERSSGYIAKLTKPITNADITQRYETLKRQSDPFIVNVIEIKFDQLNTRSDSQSKEAAQLLSEGKTLNEVGQTVSGSSYNILNYQSEEWRPTTAVGKYIELTPDTQTPTLIGPVKHLGELDTYFYLKDVRLIPLRTLNSTVPLDPDMPADEQKTSGVQTVSWIIHRALFKEQRENFMKGLYKAARVTEDGKELTLPLEFPDCAG